MGREQLLSAPAFEPASAISRSAGLPFADVDVFTDPAGALADWAELEVVAPISGYQTRRWILPWIETVGRDKGICPLLAVARDGGGRPVALLPLGMHRLGPIRAAAFLGGRDANLHIGLFRPDREWSAQSVWTLLRRIARAVHPSLDLYVLLNQPHLWDGFDNPLAHLARQPSPSFFTIGDLDRDPDRALARRFSQDARKRLRKKARRLANHIGPLRHAVARDQAAVRSMLAAFQGQKAVRLQAQGLPDRYADASLAAFLERAAVRMPGFEEPGIELHALYAGDRIVATFGGTQHGRRFSGMFNSFETDPEIARSSPGDLLMVEIVRQKCAAGCLSFDLGIGEASYKQAYCDRIEPFFDSILPVSAAGCGAAAAVSLARHAKRLAKQTPWIWSAALMLRRLRHCRLR